MKTDRRCKVKKRVHTELSARRMLSCESTEIEDEEEDEDEDEEEEEQGPKR
jgi:hypothetical protein